MMWEDVVYTLKADAALGAAMSNSSVADTLNFNRYNRVSDVEDLVTSSYYHYMNANGRLFPHMTSQTFGALIGKPLFNVLNALMFVLLICVFTYLVTNTRKDYWRWWVVVLSALWFLLPATNTCFFLMTYALNYLWSSVLCISFLLLYQYSSNRQQSLLFIFLGCLFSFGAGWSHEGIAVGIEANADSVTDAMNELSNMTVDAYDPNIQSVDVSGGGTSIIDEIKSLKDAILGMQLVLDTGATVGGLAPAMDRQLGSFAVYNGRGN
jgi:hypothetical protein